MRSSNQIKATDGGPLSEKLGPVLNGKIMNYWDVRSRVEGKYFFINLVQTLGSQLQILESLIINHYLRYLICGEA